MSVNFNMELVLFFRSSSEKYSPIDWSSYFDKEDDISITGSNDVTFNELILKICRTF